MRFLLPCLISGILAAAETPAAADQAIKGQAKLLAGSPAAELQAPILPAWDKPVGEGFSIGGTKVAAKSDDKGKLEIDTEGKGTFHTIPAKGGTVAVKIEREVEGKPKSVSLPLQFSRGADGVWRWRDAAAVGVVIAGEELLAVDVDGDGAFNTPGVDGLLWNGQAYAFPLPGPDQRWCTAKLDLTGFRIGPWGESVEVKGRMLATTVPAALPVLQDVNRERVKIGLCPRPENTGLSADLQKHCHYMAVNNQLTHPEDKAKPSFTPEGDAAGQRSILGMGTPAEMLGLRMVATFFHRIDVIRPQTTGFGVGYEGRYGGIDGRTSLDGGLAVAWPVLCPAPGQREVPLRFENESPDPIAGDKDAGFPVTAYFATANLKLTEGTLSPLGKDGKPGKAIDCYRFDPQSAENQQFIRYQQVVALIAKDPLLSGTTYRVVMKVEVDGTARDLTWDFATEGGAKKRK